MGWTKIPADGRLGFRCCAFAEAQSKKHVPLYKGICQGAEVKTGSPMVRLPARPLVWFLRFSDEGLGDDVSVRALAVDPV